MSMPAFTRSLSARLLVMTVLFVMVAEVLIYTPSIAQFRMTWLDEKLAAGHLATLALVATPQGMVTEELQRELLDHGLDLLRRVELHVLRRHLEVLVGGH